MELLPIVPAIRAPRASERPLRPEDLDESLCPVPSECREGKRDGDGHGNGRNGPRQNSVDLHNFPHLPQKNGYISMLQVWE